MPGNGQPDSGTDVSMSRIARGTGASKLSPNDPAFRALKTLIIERTGHHYYVDKDAHLSERLLSRMAETGDASAAAYLERLRDDALGEAEWPLLESAVTINETFFFRFAEQFDLLRRVILPRLLAANRESRRLRVWSVGCSNGAEPYSLAILLHDLLGDARQDWQISILGTDIDEAALQAARRAVYSAWSLRTLGEAERQRLFDLGAGGFRLKPHYRGMVRFERFNMTALPREASPLQFSAYDLILCRNVLIYFRADAVVDIVGALAGRLAPHGYLLLGHAESSPEFERVAALEQIDGVAVYRPPNVRSNISVAFINTAMPSERSPRRPTKATPAPKPASRRVRRIAAHAPAPEPAGSLGEIREALSQGDATTARALADRRSRAEPQDAAAHYLAALGALALGHHREAETGFRRALYLDRDFAMAHYILGRQLLAEGRHDEGRRSLANALHAAASLDPSAELPEGDGMTAGALVTAVRVAIG